MKWFRRALAVLNRQRKKILYVYLTVFFFIEIVLLLSFLIIIFVSDSAVIRQSVTSAAIVHQQAREQLMQVEDDFANICFNIAQSAAVHSFMAECDNYERWVKMEGVREAVEANRRVNQNLNTVILRDKDNNILFSLGDTFFEEEQETLGEMIHFSGRIWDKERKKAYFEVGMPVYGRGMENDAFLGSIWLLCDTENLESIARNALMNSASAIAVVDSDGENIVKAGKWKEYYKDFHGNSENEKLLVFEEGIGDTGWRIINVVPKAEYLYGNKEIRLIIFAAYIIVNALMILLGVLLYRRIVAPIARQKAFMSEFKLNPDRRIELIEKNEIGEMALRLNEMLDDIENLNTEILDSKQKYLELEYEKKQTELVAYRNQITPHFLYNTFNCIRGLALYHDEKEIAELTMALSGFFRYCVQGGEMVTVKEALESLQKYALIMKYRFSGRYRIEVETPKEFYRRQIPKMLMQPLVENAIFHGLEPKAEGGEVKVAIGGDDMHLHIVVSDTGCGMDVQTQKKLHDAMECYDRERTIAGSGHGIGFLNVYRRVRIFYGMDAVFTMESKEGDGTMIRLELPTGGFDYVSGILSR